MISLSSAFTRNGVKERTVLLSANNIIVPKTYTGILFVALIHFV